MPAEPHHARLRPGMNRNGKRMITERETRLPGRKKPLVTFFQCSLPTKDAAPGGNSLVLAAIGKSRTEDSPNLIGLC